MQLFDNRTLILDAAIDRSSVRGTLTISGVHTRALHGWLEFKIALEGTAGQRRSAPVNHHRGLPNQAIHDRARHRRHCRRVGWRHAPLAARIRASGWAPTLLHGRWSKPNRQEDSDGRDRSNRRGEARRLDRACGGCRARAGVLDTCSAIAEGGWARSGSVMPVTRQALRSGCARRPPKRRSERSRGRENSRASRLRS
jgi:hypothetical protein